MTWTDDKRRAYQRDWRTRNAEKRKAKDRAYYEAHKGRWAPGSEYSERSKKRRNTTPKGRFANYRQNAKARGVTFALTFDQFMAFWQQPCYYCGESILTIGIDRLDSSQGYTADNIRPCCWVCNRMKLDMSEPIFLAQCQKILRYRGIYAQT